MASIGRLIVIPRPKAKKYDFDRGATNYQDPSLHSR